MMLMKLINHNLVASSSANYNNDSNTTSTTPNNSNSTNNNPNSTYSTNSSTTTTSPNTNTNSPPTTFVNQQRINDDLSALLDFLNKKQSKEKVTVITTDSNGVVKSTEFYKLSTSDKSKEREITISGSEGKLIIDSHLATSKWGIFSRKEQYLPIYSLLTQKSMTIQQLSGSITNPGYLTAEGATCFFCSGYQMNIVSKTQGKKSVLSEIRIWTGEKWYRIIVNQ